jgi:trigger factor
VLGAMVQQSKVSAPESLVKDEAAKSETNYLKKLEELHIKLDDYLKIQNTTIEKLRNDWASQAENRLAQELLLLQIIKDQKLTITQPEIDLELSKVTDAKMKTDLETPDGKRYLVTLLLQQKAVDWLIAEVKKNNP